jgi:hypothetical protein
MGRVARSKYLLPRLRGLSSGANDVSGLGHEKGSNLSSIDFFVS